MFCPKETLNCVLCEHGVETPIHLFLHYHVVIKDWEYVFCWFDINFIIPKFVCALQMLEGSGWFGKQ